jgi:hypothetical protein
VLRFINAGTDDREAGTRGGKLHGNRGRISATNFFAQNEITIMNKASEELVAMIDDLIAKVSK